jgi:hypothetical protein
MADINVTEEIIDINVTEEVVNIISPSGGYPLPNTINSVFGRVGNIVATEGDYTLTQLGDVILTSPANGQVLKYNGTQWINSTDIDTGITTLNTLTALSQTFATGSSGTDFNISSATSTHTFNLPTASATNRGLLSSADWTTFNSKQNALTNPVTGTGTTNSLPKFTGVSTIGNSNVSDSGTLITLGVDTNFSGFSAGTFTKVLPAGNTFGGLANGSTGNFTGSANGWGIVSRQTWNINDDAFTYNGLTANDTRIIVNRSATSSIGYTVYQGSINNSGTATQNVLYGIYQALTSGNGNFGSVVAYKVGTSGTPSNTGTYTNYWAFQSSFLPLNIANFYGLEINDYTATTLSRALNLNMAAGTGKYNIYAGGTANNYMAGSLGIGSTTLAGNTLTIGKNITGGSFAFGVVQQGIVQSDVTSQGYGFINQFATQAATFTLGTYFHYFAQQTTIGAGSSITNQNGFMVSPSLIGATNNYGFRGQIPSGTNRWNLYMDGTAANYLAGDTAIGTTSLGTATMFTLGGTETAVSAIARGQLINTTLVASANSDVLVGLDIQPTFTNGAFTGVKNYGLRVNSGLQLAGNVGIVNSIGNEILSQGSNGLSFNSGASGGYIRFLPFQAGSYSIYMFSTGNVQINSGTTDNGFKFDVNGTTRFIGTASSDTAPLGAELAAVTGTGTNWTLAGSNLNVGGYTHTVGSVDPLTTALAAVNGTYYQIAYTITGRTTGSITINYGGTSTSGITATGATGPLASSTAVLTITPTTDFDGTVVLSIKTIGTSSASSTFSNSGSTSNIEVRTSNINTNTFIGLSSGRRNTTGSSNTFVGSQSAIQNTTGTFNTFIGASSGANNTTANQNTFIGFNSGNLNTTGGSNTFVGTFSGQANTTGGNNTFVGLNVGQANTTGSNNSFLGRGAGQVNTTGNENTFVGQESGLANTTGNANTFIGRESGLSNTTGSNNTGIGWNALRFQTTGGNNTAIGRDAGRFITGGSVSNTISIGSIFIGDSTRALADNQTNQIVIGNGTTGLGSNTTVIGTTATTITGLYGNIRLVSGMGTAPASATATGTTGDIVVTAGFIYVCTATNTWVRTILTTF